MHVLAIGLWVVIALAALALLALLGAARIERRRALADDLVLVKLGAGGLYLNIGEPCRSQGCPVYWCPASGGIECAGHGRFDVCCLNPHLHEYLDAADGVVLPGEGR